MPASFSEITKVKLRDFWPNEATDFTPWLASGENIARLSNAIGMDLEVENTEVAVGPYSADILARDTGSGGFVVIENQLGKTDHDHLGKLLTYGSVLNASAVIWIAGDFTEEHEKALNWLNEKTSQEIGFYGVRLEVWKIGDSEPALRFDVLSRPAELGRTARDAASGTLSETKKLQLGFWTEYRKQLLEKNVVGSAPGARPRYWYNLGLGRTGFNLSSVADTMEKKIGVRVYLSAAIVDDALPLLEIEKDQIETTIGQKLLWNPNPDNRDKIIALFKSADISLKDEWPNQCAWLVEITKKFQEAFVPRIKKLNLDMAKGE